MSNKVKSAKKRGNNFGFWFFRFLTKTLGIKSAYAFLHIVALYYLLFDSAAVMKSMPYIKRRFPNSSKYKTYLHVYRLFVSQGKQLIDRYVYLSNPDFFTFLTKENVNINNITKNKDKGFIVLTSHFGNWQIGLGTLQNLKSGQFNILMKPENNDSTEKTLHFQDGSLNINTISSDQDFGGALEITKALQAGEIVSMMGDRTYGSKSMPANFLGDEAEFPIAAYQLAAIVKCPIIFMHVVKEETKKYTVYMNEILQPEFKSSKNKQASTATWLSKYVKELENLASQYPYQCFIFEDIWK